MSADGVVQLVIDQVTEVQAEQPGLELVLEYTGEMIVRGDVHFSIDHNGRTYKDSYQVEIVIPPDYPASPPTVKETGGAVPADFHRFPKTGNLCLAAPVELVRAFAQDLTLRHYINRLLIPYLFSYTHFREHGQLPHGELDHGAPGLLQFYKEYFQTNALVTTKLLKLLASEFPPANTRCPCKNGKRLVECHGPKLDELRLHYWPQHFNAELQGIVKTAEVSEAIKREQELAIRTHTRNKQQRARKKARKNHCRR